MLVIVLENAPPRLRGYLTRLFLEAAQGCMSATIRKKCAQRTWAVVKEEIGEGNAVLVWAKPDDLGIDFDTCGVNRRIPVELDGLKLCSFMPPAESVRKADVETTQKDW